MTPVVAEGRRAYYCGEHCRGASLTLLGWCLMLPPWTALNEFDAHAFKVGAIQQVGFRRAVRSRIIRTGSTGTPIMQRKNRVVQKAIRQKRSVCAPRIHGSMVEYQAISAFLGKANRTLL